MLDRLGAMSETPGDGAQRPQLRIGYAEREATMDILNQSAGEGRLTLDELEERLDAASQAMYQSDLDKLVADLPAGQPAQSKQLPAMVPPPSMDVDWSAPELRATWLAVHRAAGWQVPDQLIVSPEWNAVVLNLVGAVPPPSGVCHMRVRGGYGSFVLIVDEGWGVHWDAVHRNAWSTARFLPEVPTVAAPGKPQIILTGDTGYGRFVVRGPRSWDSWMHHENKN